MNCLRPNCERQASDWQTKPPGASCPNESPRSHNCSQPALEARAAEALAEFRHQSRREALRHGREVDLSLSIQESAMADLVSELTERAKALPPEERARLAEELLATLDPGDDDVEVAWEAEIRKRVAEVENGTVQLVPADEAFARVRQALRR